MKNFNITNINIISTVSHNPESKQHFHTSHLICYEYEIVYSWSPHESLQYKQNMSAMLTYTNVYKAIQHIIFIIVITCCRDLEQIKLFYN